jgi:type II restriction/modification system DNA methylase subunit YeeA
MDAPTFINKWSKANLSEQAASQEHFLDLCRLLGVKTPAELDPVGDTFTFEKGAKVSAPASLGSKGDRGRADVWYKGRFAWEYKRQNKHKTLEAAYQQLQQYREGLENPPLLIVCDITRTEIHTNFTGYKPEVHTILLEDFAAPGVIPRLRQIFTDPEAFKPKETVAEITVKVASKIGLIAQQLRDRDHDPHTVAHFLMKCMFCLFAEDVELLPKKLFQTVLEKSKGDPARLKKQMDALFAAMRTGGDFGTDDIAYFNGGLFDTAPALELTDKEAATLLDAAKQQWAAVEPSIFGTLFERSLDPDKRAQIGAHYTSRDDIMLVVEPVIVRPLRREWEAAQLEIEDQLTRRRTAKTPATKKKADDAIADLLDGFQQRLAAVRVLDPACGSGNFLYVAIQQLLALEKEVITYASREELGRGGLLPRVRPTQLLGIEINPYAAELAQVVIWIGYLQWMRDNGFNAPRNPILEPITTIENRDAILAWEDEQGQPIPVWREGAACRGQAKWPEADFIVGNPPFLGSKLFRANGVPDSYIECLYHNFTLPNTSDLVCYWFEIGRQQLTRRKDIRLGLIATQGIRAGGNRIVLERIQSEGQIFSAWSDREWVLDGATVHVSIVCFDNGKEATLQLDGLEVSTVNSDLNPGVNTSVAIALPENNRISFMAMTPAGTFDVTQDKALEWLRSPNAHGKPNIEVLKPWVNATDMMRRSRSMWTIDFGVNTSINEAACYELPFEYVKTEIYPIRSINRRKSYAEKWWLYVEPRPAMRRALRPLKRFIATPLVSKHRIFVWMESSTVCANVVIVLSRSDDYFMGVVQSSVHELWARRMASQLREASSGTRYTPTTCFETFPLPWPPGHEPAEGSKHRPLHDAIAAAAKALNDQRERWLNPPEWIAEVAAEVDAKDDFADVAKVSGPEAQRLIRQSAIDAGAAQHPKLKKRTLTNLYNERPTWLRLAHLTLDRAVLNAYAATDPTPHGQSGWTPAWAEVFEPTGAGQPLPEAHPLTQLRAETEQNILAALLKLNLQRSSPVADGGGGIAKR